MDNGRLIFLYERCMTKEVRDLVKIRGDPLTLGMIKGCIYKSHEGKRRDQRLLFVPGNSQSNWIYGVIFRVDDWENEKLKFGAYYSSLQFNNNVIDKNSVIKFEEHEVVPFSLEKLDDLRICKFKKVGKPIKMIVPCYNELNETVPCWLQWKKIDRESVKDVLREKGWSKDRLNTGGINNGLE